MIDAYLAELDAFYAAANPPNPDHPALAETATGPQLDRLKALLHDLRDRGLGLRRGEASTHDPRVTRLETKAAVIEDCGVDADVKFDLESGDIVDDRVVTGRLRARLVKSDYRWLVQDSNFTEGPCAT